MEEKRSTKSEVQANLENDSSDEESLFSEESLYKTQVDTEMQKILTELSEKDFKRYEIFRCSNFPKAAIKKLISSIIGQAVNPNIVIGVAGMSKVFVGEMIRAAKEAQSHSEQPDGPLLPSHINEAYRKLYRKLPNMKVFKKFPW